MIPYFTGRHLGFMQIRNIQKHRNAYNESDLTSDSSKCIKMRIKIINAPVLSNFPRLRGVQGAAILDYAN